MTGTVLAWREGSSELRTPNSERRRENRHPHVDVPASADQLRLAVFGVGRSAFLLLNRPSRGAAESKERMETRV